MIRDARVLQAHFVPDEIEHRNAEINALSNTLAPIMDSHPGEPSLLLGPSGAGKTCVARYTVDRLCENVLDINTRHINCWQLSHFEYLNPGRDGRSVADGHR